MSKILSEEAKDEPKQEKPNVKGDKWNITMLILLCYLQGAVAGITSSFPIILRNRKVSYADQAEYSITSYPICFKLLWAPIVDCLYSRRIGRRKSWLIPMQYLMGILLLVVSMNLDNWLGSEDGTRKTQIDLLTMIFFMLSLFTAVEGVALEGWSLTMLQKRNVGYVGLCQNIGATAGIYSTYLLLILLDSKDFCNQFRSVPQDHGFVSLADFIFFWSVMVILCNTLIFIFKRDNSLKVMEENEPSRKFGLKESYEKLWQVIQLRPIIRFCLILLTCRIAFAPLSVLPLKMIDAGVSLENYILFTTPTFPFQMILSIVFRQRVTGPRAMRSYVFTYILKLIVGLLLITILFFSLHVKGDSHTLPTWYLWILFVTFNASCVIDSLLSTSLIAFLCRISDARYGGIYMTLFGTMLNIGMNWPVTVSLWFIDDLTIKTCFVDETNMTEICRTKLDGFYVETIILTLIGTLWLVWGKREIYKLEDLDASAWTTTKREASVREDGTFPDAEVNLTIS